MIDVANQGEAMAYMLGAIAVLFVVVYRLVSSNKDSDH